MGSTSPNFGLFLATTSDVVGVTTHIAGNFSTIDSLLSIAHTGTGQIKASVPLTTPTLTSPNLVGTMNGGTIIATTGSFQTITATGGTVIFTALAVGTYNFPSTIGTNGQVLTVQTGNAQWITPAPATGANEELSNLTTVAINTSLNTFSAGFVTVDRVVASSGALSGLTSIAATTGTFSANLVVTGTVSAAAVNCTGGTITAAGFAIGTYSYPTTVGSTNQFLVATTGNARFVTRTVEHIAFSAVSTANTSIHSGTKPASVVFGQENFDVGSIFDHTATSVQVTISASGDYMLGGGVSVSSFNGPKNWIAAGVCTSSGGGIVYSFGQAEAQTNAQGARAVSGSVIVRAASGDTFGIKADVDTGNAVVIAGYFWGYKLPEAITT